MARVISLTGHLFALLAEMVRYAWVHDMWWPVALAIALLVVSALVVGVTVGTPYIYTIF